MLVIEGFLQESELTTNVRCLIFEVFELGGLFEFINDVVLQFSEKANDRLKVSGDLVFYEALHMSVGQVFGLFNLLSQLYQLLAQVLMLEDELQVFLVL